VHCVGDVHVRQLAGQIAAFMRSTANISFLKRMSQLLPLHPSRQVHWNGTEHVPPTLLQVLLHTASIK
jgi:hypothetical protein